MTLRQLYDSRFQEIMSFVIRCERLFSHENLTYIQGVGIFYTYVGDHLLTNNFLKICNLLDI